MTEIAITDGQRTIGRLIERAGAFEAHHSEAGYICKAPTVAEARKALLRADREHSASARELAGAA